MKLALLVLVACGAWAQDNKAQQEASSAAKARADAEIMRQADEKSERIRRQRAKEQAVIDAEEAALADAEQERVRKTCSVLFTRTANRKVSDLTVLETKKVQACTMLGYYER